MSAPNLKEIEWAIAELERQESDIYAMLVNLYFIRDRLRGVKRRSRSYTTDEEEQTGLRHLTPEIAQQWTSQMCNEDGSLGPHWSIEQVRQIQQKKKELQAFDEADVFAVINMMYSDYCTVAKKLGVNNIDFYVGMTKSWLEDEDVSAGNEKTARYYEYIVK